MHSKNGQLSVKANTTILMSGLCLQMYTIKPMTDPRLELPSYRICGRCGRIMTRENKSEIDGEIICTVCVEGEMEEKDEADTNN